MDFLNKIPESDEEVYGDILLSLEKMVKEKLGQFQPKADEKFFVKARAVFENPLEEILSNKSLM